MDIVLILENIRSAHNVGTIIRTANFLGVSKIFYIGITPWPQQESDTRLPHVARRAQEQIAKTSLGAESAILHEHHDSINSVLAKNSDYTLVALEQDPRSVPITSLDPTGSLALVFGNEVSGVSPETLNLSDVIVEIPRIGPKNSLNVSSAVAVSVGQLRLLHEQNQ